MSLNKVMLIGNVVNDPEVRYLDGNPSNAGNAKVASFRLATNERYRDRNGETKENTEFHNIVAWRSSADLAEKFIRKGTQIYVEGKLRTRAWTDQTGAKRYTTEIQVDTIQLLGRKSDNPAAAPQGAYGAPAQPYGAPAYQQSAPSYGPAYPQGAPSYPQSAPSYQQGAPAPAYQQPAPAQTYAAPSPAASSPAPSSAPAPSYAAPAPSSAPAAPDTQPISIDLDPDHFDDLPF